MYIIKQEGAPWIQSIFYQITLGNTSEPWETDMPALRPLRLQQDFHRHEGNLSILRWELDCNHHISMHEILEIQQPHHRPLPQVKVRLRTWCKLQEGAWQHFLAPGRSRRKQRGIFVNHQICDQCLPSLLALVFLTIMGLRRAGPRPFISSTAALSLKIWTVHKCGEPLGLIKDHLPY
jgi:hypothetical protein